MKTKVMETIKELGFEIVKTSPVYGEEDAGVHAEKEGCTINTTATKFGLSVHVKHLTGDAVLHLAKGELPDLRFRGYTPEMLEIVRRFGEVAGFDI